MNRPRMIYGGRMSGKSTRLIEEVARLADARGGRGLIVANDSQHAKTLVRMVDEMIEVCLL